MRTAIFTLACIGILVLTCDVSFSGEPEDKPVEKKMHKLPPEIVEKIEELVKDNNILEIIKLWETTAGAGPEYREINETFRRTLLMFRLVQLNRAFFKAWCSRKEYVHLPSYVILEILKDKRAMNSLLSQIDVRVDSPLAANSKRYLLIYKFHKGKDEEIPPHVMKMLKEIVSRQVLRDIIKDNDPPELVNMAKKVLESTRITYLAEKIERLNRYNRPDLVSYYRALLEDGMDEIDAMTKYNMLTILARFGGKKDAAVVTKLLNDTNTSIRNNAIWCLGRLKYKSAANAIAKLLDKKDTAGTAAIALARIGEKAYLPKISAIARDMGGIPGAKSYVHAMVIFGDRTVLDKWLKSDRPEVRALAAEVLSEEAGENDCDALVNLLEGEPTTAIVYNVAKALLKTGAEGENNYSALKAAYKNAAGEKPDDYDIVVQRTLIQMGDEGTEKEVLAGLKDADADKRAETIKRIGTLGIKKHVGVLIGYLADSAALKQAASEDSPKTVGQAAAAAVVEITGVGYLGLWMDHDLERTEAEIKRWWEANNDEE